MNLITLYFLVCYFVMIINKSTMLYIIATVLVVFWLIGFCVLHAGLLVHLLLAIAIFILLFKLFNINKTSKHPSFKPMQIAIKK